MKAEAAARLRIGTAVMLATFPASFTASAQPAGPDRTPCVSDKAAFAVGELYSEELAERARAAAGARVVRKIVSGEPDTMELREDRLNLEIGASGAIIRARCG